ncbi:NUDIX domain-containing protein [Phthorimaea operculella]|nr:NUDIX domain-containing protein [Phthorimaea operculella]
MTSQRAAFCTSQIFSLASRERCMANLRSFRVPNGWKAASPGAPHSAVMIPLCNVDDRPSLLYTARSQRICTHCGYICFPGGVMEDNENPIQAALKAIREQIGLSPTKVDIWGQGVPLPSRNQQFQLTPVVGSIMDLQKGDVNMNVMEVSEVFAVPLEVLCNPKNQFYTQFREGYVLPVFLAEDYKIWGITAYITHMLLDSLLPREDYKNEWTKKKIDFNEKDDQVELGALNQES